MITLEIFQVLITEMPWWPPGFPSITNVCLLPWRPVQNQLFLQEDLTLLRSIFARLKFCKLWRCFIHVYIRDRFLKNKSCWFSWKVEAPHTAARVALPKNMTMNAPWKSRRDRFHQERHNVCQTAVSLGNDRAVWAPLVGMELLLGHYWTFVSHLF